MKTSILWNGFEIKKGEISTSVGFVPYLCYTPAISKESVNIAIHGEGHDKEDWLCFNSTLKLGNLLKESIKHNSPFIAFDIYGHGDWVIDDHHFNTSDLTSDDITNLIKKSITGIEEAIPKILKEENLTNNPISLTAFSLGCSISLGLKLDSENFKSVLISPYKAPVYSNCKNYYVIRGENDPLISENEFNDLFNELPENTVLEKFDSKHEIPVSWINRVKTFIY